MSNQLTKLYTPFFEGIPPTPGDPGSPGFPPSTERSWIFHVTGTFYGLIGYDAFGGAIYGTLQTGWWEQVTVPVPGTPATPPTPGEPGRPSIPAQWNIGWTGGADSIPTLEGSGEYSFSVPANAVGVVTGFNNHSNGAGYAEIDFAISCQSGQFTVKEGSLDKTAPAPYATSDVFSIRRRGRHVYYYRNATLVYTSLESSVGVVVADASLYFGGDVILNASMRAYEVFSVAGELSGVAGIWYGSSGVADVGEAYFAVEGELGGVEGRWASSMLAVSGELSDGDGEWFGSSGAADIGEAYGIFHGQLAAPGGTLTITNTLRLEGTGELSGVAGEWYGSSGAADVGEAYFVTNGALSGLGGTFTATNALVVVAGDLGSLRGAWYGSSGVGDVGEAYFSIAGELAGVGGAVVSTNVLGVGGGLEGALGGVAGAWYGSSGAADDGTNYFVVAGELNRPGGECGIDLDTPQYFVVEAGLTPLGGRWNAPSNSLLSVTGQLNPVRGFFTNTENLYVDGELLNPGGVWLDSEAGPLVYDTAGVGDMTLPNLTMDAFGEIIVVLDPDGNPAGYGLDYTLLPLSMEAYGGGVGDMTLKPLSSTAVGQMTLVGVGDMTLPRLLMTGTGVLTFVGAGDMTLKPLSMEAYAGGVGDMELLELSAEGVGILGMNGVGDMTLLPLEADAVGVIWLNGVGDMTLPPLSMDTGGVGDMTLLPLAMEAAGLLVVTAVYEGYNFTLVASADGETVYASHITTFPFRKIVAFKGRYYGVADDGLYLLEGMTFAGGPILPDVITAETDFGNPDAREDPGPHLKRPIALWLDGRFGTDLEVSMISSELEQAAYGDVLDTPGAGNRRVKFGRGVRARHWAYRLRTRDGGLFDLNAMSPEFDVLRRSLP